MAEAKAIRLVLTAYDDDPYIFAMLQAGASGLRVTSSPQPTDKRHSGQAE